MSRIYDYLLVGVITIISTIIHTIAIELFGPDTKLYDLATQATEFGGAAKADLWFQILAIWAPLIATAGIVLWAFVREWRRQSTTARVPSRPP